MFKFVLPLIFLSSLSFADTYFVEEVSGETAQGKIGAALVGLIKNEVVKQGHVVSLDPSLSQWVLSPNLYSLGESYIMTLSKSRNGQIVFSEKLKSKTQEGLDIVSERLVRSAVHNKRLVETETVDLRNKREVIRQAYFGFGAGSVSGLKSDKSGFAYTIGYLWGLDPQFGLRLNFDGVNASGSGADVLMLGLGGQYYLNNLKHAPYILGLIGHSWSDSEDASACASCTGDSAHGWAAEIGIGMHFFRNSAINLAVEATHSIGFYDVATETPGATSLKLVVLW